MSDGISPNKLNDLSQVYIDQVAAFREIRKQETQKDIERWSQPAQNALQQEAVGAVAGGAAKVALGGAALAGKAAVTGAKFAGKTAAYLGKKAGNRIGKELVKATSDVDTNDDKEFDKVKVKRYKETPVKEEYVDEAKVDTGSAAEKASARNKRNTPPGKDYKFDTSVFITRKPGESLDSARTRKRREAHDAKRGVKEDYKRLPVAKMAQKISSKSYKLGQSGFDSKNKTPEQTGKMIGVLDTHDPERAKKRSKLKESWSDWRTELREVLKEPETEAESQKEVVEKKVKNKIEINPKISEAIEEIGGQVLSVEEQDTYQSHIEDAVEYFYEQGINERGVELIIEEVGLEDFVEFVIDPSEDLMEARKARRASVRAKKFPEVKADVDKADAARKKAKKGEYAPSYAKKETDVTDYGDKAPAKKKPAAMKKAVARKKAVLKQPIAKKATPAKKAQTQKKVVKSVAKVKKVQPAKPVSKKGIRGVIQRGVERHQKAVGKAKAEVQKVAKIGRDTAKQHREHGKKFISGLRATPKEKKIAGGIAKAAKKALTREEYETQKRKEVLAALKRDRRPLDTKTKEKIASDIVKKKGDTSKSDDRYAYEAYTVTAADKKGNTPAWKRYKAGAKNVKTGEPLYKKADHVAEADSLAGQISRWEAGRRKRMKASGTYERPNWIPRDQDHSDEYGSSKGKKSTAEGYQRNPEKGEAEERKAEKKRKASGAMPPRGDKRREDFERWYAANVR